MFCLVGHFSNMERTSPVKTDFGRNKVKCLMNIGYMENQAFFDSFESSLYDKAYILALIIF